MGKISHTTSWTGGIQTVGSFIGAAIECVIVWTLVDPYTPQENGRMVAPLQHHFLRVDQSLLFPFLAANMLPAGNFRKH